MPLNCCLRASLAVLRRLRLYVRRSGRAACENPGFRLLPDDAGRLRGHGLVRRNDSADGEHDPHPNNAGKGRAGALSYLKDPVDASVNAYLINTGSKLVLVDTGAGTLFGPTVGKLLANLRAAGYQPEQVDEVVITHMHGDHVGGLMSGDKLAFPNAVVRADKHDADFWLSKSMMEAAPKEVQEFFQGAMKSLNPYLAAGKLQTFEGDTEVVPGVRAMASHGHTPGHTTYVVESKGQKLVLWGDLMHVAAVQFDEPSVTIQFDIDPKAAAAQRRKAYAEAAKQGYWVGAAHLSFPGLGHLRSEGKRYVWVPANYAPAR